MYGKWGKWRGNIGKIKLIIFNFVKKFFSESEYKFLIFIFFLNFKIRNIVE